MRIQVVQQLVAAATSGAVDVLCLALEQVDGEAMFTTAR
jgi:hypothetical protein